MIYVMRNPKDNAVSYYHFSKVYTDLQTPRSFESFFEDYMSGNGETTFTSGWFTNDDLMFNISCRLMSNDNTFIY